MNPPSTLGIPRWAMRAHEMEIVRRLRESSRPLGLDEVFHGSSPRWAIEAVERLLASGELWEDAAGKLLIVATRAGEPIDSGISPIVGKNSAPHTYIHSERAAERLEPRD